MSCLIRMANLSFGCLMFFWKLTYQSTLSDLFWQTSGIAVTKFWYAIPCTAVYVIVIQLLQTRSLFSCDLFIIWCFLSFTYFSDSRSPPDYHWSNQTVGTWKGSTAIHRGCVWKCVCVWLGVTRLTLNGEKIILFNCHDKTAQVVKVVFHSIMQRSPM